MFRLIGQLVVGIFAIIGVAKVLSDNQAVRRRCAELEAKERKRE